MHKTTRRLGAALSGAALTLGVLAVAPTADAAAAEPKALTDSIAWVQSQLDSHGLLPGLSGSGDYSLTADYALGLLEVGHTDQAKAVAASLDAQAATYVGNGITTLNTARAAQAIWAGELAMTKPTPLMGQLEASIAAGGESVDDDNDPSTPDKTVAADAAGRALDKPFSKWTGTIGQAWIAKLLQGTPSSKAAPAMEFLLKQQCASGEFRYSWSAVDASDQSCDADPAAFLDPDTTAYVAILLANSTDPDVDAAVDKAISWLLSQQQTDGSFAAGYDASAFNANTTGLAARAFALNGQPAAARKAATWIRRHQIVAVPGCPVATDADKGAIAGTDSDLADAAGGIAASVRGSWQSSAGQAFAALAVLPPTVSAPVVHAPSGYRAARSTATFTVSGAAAGDVLCLTAGGTAKRVSADANGSAAASVALPAATTTLTATVADETGVRSTARVSVLGATKPVVKLSKTKLKRGKTLTVRLRGLASGENLTLKLGRKTAKVGTANASGRAVLKVKLTKKLVKRAGKVRVTVVGQFANRTNAKTVKVLR